MGHREGRGFRAQAQTRRPTRTANGYATDRTVSDLISSAHSPEHRAFLERVASLTIDGKLLRDEPFRQLTADPREHRGARPFLEILTLARGQTPEQLRSVVCEALERKQRKAPRYGLNRPLWLFIEVTDQSIRARQAFEEFVCDGFPPITPYELVVVIYNDVAIAVDAAGVRRRLDYASVNRDDAFWPWW